MNSVAYAPRLLDLAQRLNAVLDAEAGLLDGPFDKARHDDILTSKTDLAAQLEMTLEAAKRAGRVALQQEDADQMLAATQALAALGNAMAANADALSRRRDLSRGLLDAVEAEARGRAGAPLATYGASTGASTSVTRAASLAVNAEI